VADYRLEVMDAKKKFETRVDDFRKQMDDYKKNNDVLDEMKKAHQKELAAYIQEHNRKYNELLKDKLNSEDALKAQFEADKLSLIKEWEKKLKEAVEKTRSDEQGKAKSEIEKMKKDYEMKFDVMESKIKKLE
jgi:hypothetical protein